MYGTDSVHLNQAAIERLNRRFIEWIASRSKLLRMRQDMVVKEKELLKNKGPEKMMIGCKNV